MLLERTFTGVTRIKAFQHVVTTWASRCIADLPTFSCINHDLRLERSSIEQEIAMISSGLNTTMEHKNGASHKRAVFESVCLKSTPVTPNDIFFIFRPDWVGNATHLWKAVNLVVVV